MYILPAIATVFSIISFTRPTPEDTANAKGMLTATIAAIVWFVYEGFWTYNYPVIPYLYVSYLWFTAGFIFSLVAIVYVIQYVYAGFKRKQNEGSLRLQQNEEI